MKWTEEEINFLVEKYPLNGTRYCAKYLNKDIKSISLKVSRLKLKINKDVRSLIYSKSNKQKWINYEKPLNKYKFDFTNFIDVTTKEVAYTLGFMWGDGYIKRCGISKENLVSVCHNLKSDIDEILYIFEKTGNWNKRNRKRINRKEQTIVSTNNRPFCDYLISKDFNKKSYVSPEKIMDTIPDEYIHYFYLGLSDADGCFYINDKNYTYQFSITSTIGQDWSYMINLCNNLKIKYNIHCVEKENKNGIINKYSQFRITNTNDIIIFGNFIYKDYSINNIGLYRKYLKFKEICEERIHKKFDERICPYCEKIGKGPNMTRYHFDKCKFKK